jgi:hypothetical protein
VIIRYVKDQSAAITAVDRMVDDASAREFK